MTPNQIHHKWNNREHKRPTGLGSNKIRKRNQHMIIHESQIRQHIILRKPTHDNTWIYLPKQVRTGTILQQSKQGQSKKKKKRNKPITKKTKHQHKYSRKWSSKHEIWGEEIRTHTFFLKIWRWKSAKMEFVEGDMECLDEFQLRKKWGRQWIVTKSRGKN